MVFLVVHLLWQTTRSNPEHPDSAPNYTLVAQHYHDRQLEQIVQDIQQLSAARQTRRSPPKTRVPSCGT